MKNHAWHEIADEIGRECHVLKEKLRSLQATYRRDRAKVKAKAATTVRSKLNVLRRATRDNNISTIGRLCHRWPNSRRRRDDFANSKQCLVFRLRCIKRSPHYWCIFRTNENNRTITNTRKIQQQRTVAC